MLPLLSLCADSKEHSKQDVVEALGQSFKLTDIELKEFLPSGRQAIFDNRIGWARTYLKKACLIEATRRGSFKITERGKDILAKKPKEINVKFLAQFPEFIEFREKKKPEEGEPFPEPGTLQNDQISPEEQFESLVVELLVKMGYGGSRKDAGERLGKSGDEWIDGIIKEDKLGLDIVYLQAKRWNETIVGRPEIQKFVGALQGQRARKGIFITTSSFSKEAFDFADKIENKVVLIDGKRLALLMIENDVGVSKVASYEVKKIDSDYFEEA
jgi:restriction system protein